MDEYVVRQKVKNKLIIMKRKSKEQKNKKLSGTHQWAEKTVNFISGCGHNCKYCYSKANAMMWGQNTPEGWINEVVRLHDLNKKHKKYDGLVMFPSSHDITPTHLADSITILKELLDKGNDVLIVTKPHLDCTKRICKDLAEFKNQILFRFTIGSADSAVLKFWEPNAPDFVERLECLKYAYHDGFATSVSSEPMLDDNIDAVVSAVSPYVTETIWIGKANHLLSRIKLNGANDSATIEEANKLIQWQSDPININDLKMRHANNPKIRFKHGI
jgi:DNA repair photolyase